MATLVVNPGSSSKKYALFDGERRLLSARFEQAESGFERCVELDGLRQVCEPIDAPEFRDSLGHVVSLIQSKNLPHVERVGLRVVAPGKLFTNHVVITDEYIAALTERAVRAPAHAYGALLEIEGVRTHLPDATLYAVSDSAFHTSMPPYARQFSIPREDAHRLDLERFGYHGLSVASVTRKLSRLRGSVPENVIVCHVGSGVSVTALKNGLSVDTTMGYAPGGGLIMSGRAGDLETGALLAIIESDQLSSVEASEYVQRAGGLKALAGVSDMRVILKRYAEHDANAALALDAFLYRLTLAVGGYAAALGGLDALVLTATAFERNADLRNRLVRKLSVLVPELDYDANEQAVSRDALISAPNSTPAVYVLTTDEMGEIARITESLE